MMEESLAEKTTRFARSPKSLRQMLLPQKDTEEAKICAAIELQRYARGYIVRKLGIHSYITWRNDIITANEVQQMQMTPEAVTSSTRRSVRYADTPNIYTPSATRLDESKTPAEMSKFTAAAKIQRFWRRHIDMQVYKYYRDLINFKTQGDPAMMLKCINPKESALLDAASGTHVKFRLAGDRFPPNIYYKIFTHRPIQDLGAYAPRDYTKTDCKKRDMRSLHNRNYYMQLEDGREEWYKRIENNGWRLVSDRLITHMLNDPVTWSTHHKKIENFQHTKLLRRQDVEKRKKRKKIEWMTKMYHEGLMHAKASDEETINLIKGATAGMVNTVQTEGEDAVQEWEVDELLDWTTSLNFEDYLTSWKEVGTSSLSEVLVERRLVSQPDAQDNFRLNISPQQQMRSTEGELRKTSNSPTSFTAQQVSTY